MRFRSGVRWGGVLGLALAVSAGGCGRKETPPPPPRAVVVVTPGADPLWRDQLGAVLAALRARAGVAPEPKVVTRSERVEDALIHVSGTGPRVVICLGPECGAAVFTVAPVYPTVRYVVVPGDHSARNVAAVNFAENEAAYVAAAVGPALRKTPRVLAVEGSGCGDEIFAALRNGLRIRAPGASLEEVSRAEVLEGEENLEGVTEAVVCPSPEDERVAQVLAAAGAFVVVFDPNLARTLQTHACGVIEVDRPEALVRVTQDLLERNEPGTIYTFDVGSGVVKFRFCKPDAVDPRVRQAVAEAGDEVAAGIAEIESIDLHRKKVP